MRRDNAGVQLIVGHSHTFDAPILRTRALIESGAFGPVRMINALNYTDFLYRPRRPEELDTAQGGGAVFNQARASGRHRAPARRRRASRACARRPARGIRRVRPKALTRAAHVRGRRLRFADLQRLRRISIPTSFRTGSAKWASARSPGRAEAARASSIRRTRLRSRTRAITAARLGSRRRKHSRISISVPSIVSCERADLRPMPNGVMIYENGTQRLEPLPPPQFRAWK